MTLAAELQNISPSQSLVKGYTKSFNDTLRHIHNAKAAMEHGARNFTQVGGGGAG
jgi:hypothetical protein